MNDLEKNLGTKKFSSTDENFLPNEDVSDSVDDVLTVDERFEKISKADSQFFFERFKRHGETMHSKILALSWLTLKPSVFSNNEQFFYSVVSFLWPRVTEFKQIENIKDIFIQSADPRDVYAALYSLFMSDISGDDTNIILSKMSSVGGINNKIKSLNCYFFESHFWETFDRVQNMLCFLTDPGAFYEKNLDFFLPWNQKHIDLFIKNPDYFFKEEFEVVGTDKVKNIRNVNLYQSLVLENICLDNLDRRLIVYCRVEQLEQDSTYFYLLLKSLKKYVNKYSNLFTTVEVVSRSGLQLGGVLKEDYRQQIYGFSDYFYHHDGVLDDAFKRLSVGGNFLHLSHGSPAGIESKSVDILPQAITQDLSKMKKTSQEFFVEIKNLKNISKVPSFKKFKTEMKDILNAVRACEEKEIANAKKYFAEKNKQKNT